MDSTVIVLVIVIVVLVLALVAAGVVLAQRRRSERLQEHYGPEYERSLNETGNRRAAEAQLTEREKRHRELDIRDLRSEERDRFAESWADIQREFVDDPKRAVHDADRLVLDIMRTRGYPVGDDGDDFERRAEDISVEHPDVVQRYREAHAVRDATERGDVDTENQRAAVTSYRSLVDALLDNRGHETRGDENRSHENRSHEDRGHDERGYDERGHHDDRRDDRLDDRRHDERSDQRDPRTSEGWTR